MTTDQLNSLLTLTRLYHLKPPWGEWHRNTPWDQAVFRVHRLPTAILALYLILVVVTLVLVPTLIRRETILTDLFGDMCHRDEVFHSLLSFIWHMLTRWKMGRWRVRLKSRKSCVKCRQPCFLTKCLFLNVCSLFRFYFMFFVWFCYWNLLWIQWNVF